MAVKDSGASLAISELVTEFGDDAGGSDSLSEYYAGGDNVPSGAAGESGDIPSSGTISMSQFYGSANRVAIALQIGQALTASYNIRSNVGGTYSAGGSDITLTVQANVTSGSTNQAAIETGEFASGDTVKIINNAQILAKGGSGGSGAVAQATQSNQQISGSGGGAAGHGLNLQFPVTIQNNGGTIKGGGGGGGGGGTGADANSMKGNVQTNASGGGGGGGAAVGGAGSAPQSFGALQRQASAGQAGQAAAGGNGGQGGSGGPTGQPASGGTGGNGGAFAAAGQAGDAGASKNSSGVTFTGGAGGAGGAAGKAINLNGHQVTYEDGDGNVTGAVS